MMKKYYEERIMTIESQLRVFGENEELRIKLELFKEKLAEELEQEK